MMIQLYFHMALTSYSKSVMSMIYLSDITIYVILDKAYNLAKDMNESVEITAATLNFSGINTNPFEYDDGSPIFVDLNRNFLHIKAQQFPQTNKWSGALLDKYFKTNRFTILFGNQFNENIGETLPSQEQFKQKWHHFYEDAVAKNKISQGYQAKPEEVDNVYKMDFAFYRAVVMAVYGYTTLEQYNTKSFQQDSSKLKDFLKLKRSSPPFQLSQKKQRVLKYHKHVDVMFLQQAGSVEWEQEQDYTTIKNHDSVIIYKTSIFGEPDQKETKKWQHLLDINEDSALVLTKKGFLLLSSHFKSSELFYLQQQAQLFKVLNFFIDYYINPYKLIIGIDANHRLQSDKINTPNFMVPNKPEDTTSIKKRSYIQAQLHKADQAVDDLKDHIISTLQIKSYSLQLIDGSASKKELLPNDKHPYDHFVVKAKLVLQ